MATRVQNMPNGPKMIIFGVAVQSSEFLEGRNIYPFMFRVCVSVSGNALANAATAAKTRGRAVVRSCGRVRASVSENSIGSIRVADPDNH